MQPLMFYSKLYAQTIDIISAITINNEQVRMMKYSPFCVVGKLNYVC